MVWIDLNITQLLMIGGGIGFFIFYILYDLAWHFYNSTTECDKCHGKGYLRRKI